MVELVRAVRQFDERYLFRDIAQWIRLRFPFFHPVVLGSSFPGRKLFIYIPTKIFAVENNKIKLAT